MNVWWALAVGCVAVGLTAVAIYGGLKGWCAAYEEDAAAVSPLVTRDRVHSHDAGSTAGAPSGTRRDCE